jgi:hypothetical protein
MAVRGLIVAGVVLVAVVAVEFLGRSGSPTTGATFVSTSPADPSTLPGMQTGTFSEWGSGSDQLEARLKAIGLTALPEEGKALHIHQHLDVYVDGQKVTVPTDIGISGAGFSPIHTHDTKGIIHVEANTQGPFTLGQVFDVWGVKLTPDCLGQYCKQGDKTLRVYVDGKLASGGDPRNIKLFSHEEIVVAYGTPDELPDPIPASYSFPAGY